jgi:hypothetical protein
MKNSMNLLKIALFLSVFIAFNACKKEDTTSNVKYFIIATSSDTYSGLKVDFEYARAKEVATNGDTSIVNLNLNPKNCFLNTQFIISSDSIGTGIIGKNPITQFEVKLSNAKVSTDPFSNNQYSIGSAATVILPTDIKPFSGYDYEITFEINTDESVIELPDGVLKFEPKIKVIVVEK